MVPGIHHLRLDAHLCATFIGLDRQFLDVETETVEPFDAPVDAPALRLVELLRTGELLPEVAVGGVDSIADLDRVEVFVESAARLEVEQFAGDVHPRDLEVVLTLTVREPVVELAGFGVDEVGGERAGVAAEQRVGQRDVTPEETHDVEAHKKHSERIHQPRCGLGAQ